MAQARRKDPDYANSADDPKLRSGISNPALVFDRFTLLTCFTASRMMPPFHLASGRGLT